MKKFNVVIIYDRNEEKVLMCKRAKEPYKGKYWPYDTTSRIL